MVVPRRHNHRELDVFDFPVGRHQRSILTGGDEVDPDLVLPRITKGAVFDVQGKGVVFIVARHCYCSNRRCHSCGNDVESIPLHEERLVACVAFEEGRNDCRWVPSSRDLLEQFAIRDRPLELPFELLLRVPADFFCVVWAILASFRGGIRSTRNLPVRKLRKPGTSAWDYSFAPSSCRSTL